MIGQKLRSSISSCLAATVCRVHVQVGSAFQVPAILKSALAFPFHWAFWLSWLYTEFSVGVLWRASLGLLTWSHFQDFPTVSLLPGSPFVQGPERCGFSRRFPAEFAPFTGSTAGIGLPALLRIHSPFSGCAAPGFLTPWRYNCRSCLPKPGSGDGGGSSPRQAGCRFPQFLPDVRGHLHESGLLYLLFAFGQLLELWRGWLWPFRPLGHATQFVVTI